MLQFIINKVRNSFEDSLEQYFNLIDIESEAELDELFELKFV